MTIEAVNIRPARVQDAAGCAAILNDWIDTTDWMPRVRPAEDLVRHYRDFVFVSRQVWVAEAGNEAPVGYLTLADDGFVMALFVQADIRGNGVGSNLLTQAKAARDDLQLWTFLANSGAMRFYRREGFCEVRRTEGDNEEGLPDALFDWRAAA